MTVEMVVNAVKIAVTEFREGFFRSVHFFVYRLMENKSFALLKKYLFEMLLLEKTLKVRKSTEAFSFNFLEKVSTVQSVNSVVNKTQLNFQLHKILEFGRTTNNVLTDVRKCRS